jgi:outer membrane protein assembly factor BamB
VRFGSVGAGVVGALVAAGGARAQTATVPFYHRTADHAGLFVVPGLTAASVGQTALDTGFNGSVSGVINAGLLYWRPAGASSGTVIVATENDTVYALDETTGVAVWQRQLGTAGTPDAGCGNINPLGATGTPVIDTATGTLYVEAVVEQGGAPVHQLFALSAASGAILPGWPVALGAGIRAQGASFDDGVEEQRGALALLDGKVFIPFGGYDGDCGDYHGIVASVSTTGTPAVVGVASTSAEKGGVWAPGGVVSDGTSVYVATGNTSQATTYAGGEGVFRFDSSLAPIKSNSRFFSPANWQTLDDDDYDLGGVSPTLIDLPGSKPAHLALALGKDGNGYLLNRQNLGGVGTALQTLAVSGLFNHTATARYKIGSSVMVAFNAQQPLCSSTTEGVVALSVSPGSPPVLASSWCMPLNGRGDPIVTTSDGTADPIVWATGAEGDEELHAFDGATGKVLYASPAVAGTIRHFTTLLVANGRLFLTSDNKVVAYDLP